MLKKCWLLLMFSSFFLPMPTSAQENTITLNENVLGAITLAEPAQLYQFTSASERPLIVQVNSLNGDFAPVMVLYDANERVLQRASNPTALVQRQLIFTPTPNTDYLIQILGVDGSKGEFVLTITEQPFSSAAPYTELRENYDFKDRVTLDEPFKTYQVKASQTYPVTLAVLTEGSAVVVSDEDGVILGTASQTLPASTFTIPPALNEIYYVTIFHSGIERREPFTIRLVPNTETNE